MPKKLSFEDFEEEIEGPKEKKIAKVEKAKEKAKKIEKAKAKPVKPASKPAPVSKPVPVKAQPPKAKTAPKTVSPSAYFKTAAASKRHAWTWAEFGKKANCSRPGCKASMNWAAGKRGGIVHFYLIEGDSTQRDRIPGCPCAKEAKK